LEQGILPKTWQDKMIKLILGTKTPSPSEKEEEMPTNHLSHANVEKVIHEKHRTLHKTRRNRPRDASASGSASVPSKKSMSKTRRSVRT
jgi:hypothetical protein